MECRGVIVEEQKNYLYAQTVQGLFQLSLRGNLRKKGARPCVGDQVTLRVTNGDTNEGIVTRIHSRSTHIERPPLANMDQAIVVTSMVSPALEPEMLDRTLFSASVHGCQCLLVFNKADLVSSDLSPRQDEIIAGYAHEGYEVIQTSVTTGEGIDKLVENCRGRTSFFVGISGVGKSSLISMIFPDRDLRIGELSHHQERGTHTTTHISLLELDEKSRIADTPGFAWLELPSLPEEEVVNHFPGIASAQGLCRFNNCIHDAEPDCEVRRRVAAGEIASSRYDHYLLFYRHLRQMRQQYRTKGKILRVPPA